VIAKRAKKRRGDCAVARKPKRRKIRKISPEQVMDY
jgi:hypothetical protein